MNLIPFSNRYTIPQPYLPEEQKTPPQTPISPGQEDTTPPCTSTFAPQNPPFLDLGPLSSPFSENDTRFSSFKAPAFSDDVPFYHSNVTPCQAPKEDLPDDPLEATPTPPQIPAQPPTPQQINLQQQLAWQRLLAMYSATISAPQRGNPLQPGATLNQEAIQLYWALTPSQRNALFFGQHQSRPVQAILPQQVPLQTILPQQVPLQAIVLQQVAVPDILPQRLHEDPFQMPPPAQPDPRVAGVKRPAPPARSESSKSSRIDETTLRLRPSNIKVTFSQFFEERRFIGVFQGIKINCRHDKQSYLISPNPKPGDCKLYETIARQVGDHYVRTKSMPQNMQIKTPTGTYEISIA